ncbi:hypothetical protein [Mycolicibacterium farcinogenes]|uniref:Uncharacterized protein n=1 Tax=Mycolicibacterium farcinogenes TaxID=1802 RepID=A0ACD1FQS1_MYCFR|nr:hypothetical protein [Mycolicibacterium farcinogenes]QZH69388.1 hypothetical protein K6L26_30785 [Mycolicibacterium farcinogenes]
MNKVLDQICDHRRAASVLMDEIGGEDEASAPADAVIGTTQNPVLED